MMILATQNTLHGEENARCVERVGRPGEGMGLNTSAQRSIRQQEESDVDLVNAQAVTKYGSGHFVFERMTIGLRQGRRTGLMIDWIHGSQLRSALVIQQIVRELRCLFKLLYQNRIHPIGSGNARRGRHPQTSGATNARLSLKSGLAPLPPDVVVPGPVLVIYVEFQNISVFDNSSDRLESTYTGCHEVSAYFMNGHAAIIRSAKYILKAH